MNDHKWKLDLDAPAKVWSNAPFPSKASKAKTVTALLAFLKPLPDEVTVADLRTMLEDWM